VALKLLSFFCFATSFFRSFLRRVCETHLYCKDFERGFELRPFSKLRRNNKGGVLVTVAIALPTVFLVAALCVDLGFLFIARGQAENAALFAAEAGVQRIEVASEAEDLAVSVGEDYLIDATYAQSTSIIANATLTEISVSVSIEVNPIFSGVMGRDMLTANQTVVRTP
jgi:Flp pilus assembly protein TadG